MNNSFRIGSALAIVIVLLAGADEWFKERPHRLALAQQNAAEEGTQPGPTDDTQTSASSTSSSAASQPMIIKKGTSTRKNSGIDVQAVLASLQLVPQPTAEASLLKLSAQGVSVQTVVLLSNNDRAALFSWIESDDVKTVFSALKSALQEQFSPKLQNLVDVTRTPENGPPADVLSFSDPAISPESIMFLRVRNRLYELHIVEKSKNAIEQLIAALSK